MKLFFHQTHHSIGDFDQISLYLKNVLETSESNSLHLFPELYLTGYPFGDLCFQHSFIKRYLSLLDDLDIWSSERPLASDIGAIFGGIHYTFDSTGFPEKIENSAFFLTPGHPIKKVYSKMLLPNYDIFDEKRYFTPGKEIVVLNFLGKKIALLLCEDMWPSAFATDSPVSQLHQKMINEGETFDLVVNLSASPFCLGKQEKRLALAHKVSCYLQSPLAFVNRVGGEDEVLFDGSSFLVSGDELILQGKSFSSEILVTDFPVFLKGSAFLAPKYENNWKSLLRVSDRSGQFPVLTSQECQTLVKAIEFGLFEYAGKNGLNRFTVALSGGIDSALVLTLLHFGLKKDQDLEAIFMPGFYTSSESILLAEELCRNLKVKLYHYPIKFLHSSIRNACRDCLGENLEGVADENIQSRLRGALLYMRSNQMNSMVVNTSNKSELAVGYSTLYGDSVGAISPLGDLYKTEIYQLVEYLNSRFNGIIPQGIISRNPSAELRENQSDQDALPSYSELDIILFNLLEGYVDIKEFAGKKIEEKDIKRVYDLLKKSEYKRRQFCPIIKLRSKSFGFGRRFPLTDVWRTNK